MSRLPTHTSALTALAALTPPAAAKMTSNAGALGTVNDAFSENHSLLAPMSSALNTAISVIDAIKDGLVTASQPGAELIETDIPAQQHSLPRIGSSMNITAATAGDDTLAGVETAIGSITAAAGTPGATTTNLPPRRTYVSNQSDSLTTGAGALVGASMNEAAARLAALKVEQQLGTQALSISNSNTKLILKLFEL